MLSFVVVALLGTAASAQFRPQQAKILKEKRFNAGDGRFGAAFAQEDGTVYKEETSADGERIGQYSYIDEAGKTITVKYTAGKEGFRILEGAHVPNGANGQFAAPFRQASPSQPAPRTSSFHSSPSSSFQASSPDYDYYEAEPVQKNSNPFINPHDSTHRDFRYNRNGATFGPQGVVPNAGHVPPCADCGGLNPFVNPYDRTHQETPHFPPATPAPFFSRKPVQQPQPVQRAQQAFNIQQPATQSPKRLFPPGKLNLNRFETGFNFDFTSQ